MAVKRVTKGQRKAQAHAVSENIRREAERIAAASGISFDEAFTAVLKDPVLSAACHAVGPIESQPVDWKAPER